MRARLALAALALTTFIYVTTETLPIGLLPQIAEGLGTSKSTVGLLVTAYGLVVVVTTIPLTRLTRHWPRRRLLGVLLMVFVVGTALSALAPSYPVLLGARISIALSQAVFWAVVTPVAASLFPPATRGRAVSVLYAGSSAGPLLGVPVGTWLGQQAGWRVSFFALSVIGVVVLTAVMTLLPEMVAGGSDADRGSAPDRGRYRSLVVTTALAVTGAFTAYTYVSPFLTEVSGFAETSVGPLLLIFGIADLAGVIMVGFLVARHGWAIMVTLIGTQAAGLALQYAFGPDRMVAVVAMALCSLSLAGMAATLGARVLEVAPAGTDLAGAATSTAFNVGITVGALTGSLLVTTTGVRSVALAGSLFSVVAFAVTLAEPLSSTRRRAGAAAVHRPPAQRSDPSSGPGDHPGEDRERRSAGEDELPVH
jgi:MFS transporter, DHA1 family, inner membrane transport protein